MKKTLVIFVLVVILLTVFASSALAAGSSPIPEQSPDSLGQKIVALVKDVGMPLGGIIMLVSLGILFVRMMITAHNPAGRAATLGALPFIAGGGIGLGGLLFFAGLILGIGKTTFGG